MKNRTPITRRNVLKATASAAAVSTFANLGVAFEPPKRFAGLPIGVQSYSLRNFPLDQVMRHIQGLGLHHVEFYEKHFPLSSTDDQISQMKRQMKAGQVTMTAHGVNSFSADHAKNRQVFEFAKKAGIRNITANPQPDSFDSLDKLVDEYDVRICIHNHGPGALYDSLDTVTSAVEGHHERIGACIDTGHVLRSKEDPVQWIQRLGSRVFALHVKDVAEKKKRTHDVIVGSSFLNLPGLFQALQQVNFPQDGSISLEYESNPENPIDDIQQCLNAVDKAIQQVQRA
ncbi:MAG: sugar phosphate isomerase/epimerase [Pirellulaceae bacterium]|nr:sugar phosphate isomerase/epimerase [Pirellulaceae bacterium]